MGYHLPLEVSCDNNFCFFTQLNATVSQNARWISAFTVEIMVTIVVTIVSTGSLVSSVSLISLGSQVSLNIAVGAYPHP